MTKSNNTVRPQLRPDFKIQWVFLTILRMNGGPYLTTVEYPLIGTTLLPNVSRLTGPFGLELGEQY